MGGEIYYPFISFYQFIIYQKTNLVETKQPGAKLRNQIVKLILQKRNAKNTAIFVNYQVNLLIHFTYPSKFTYMLR